MENFTYKAIGSDGKQVKGTIAAADQQEATKKLKDSGLLPVSVGVAGALDKEISFGKRKKKVTDRELGIFCRQFSSILRAGVPAIKALEMMAAQTENKTLAEGIKNLQMDVEKGANLSESMRRYPDIFPDLLANMVAAGEAAGALEVSVDRMALQFEKNAHLKGIVKKAMMYPCVLLVVMVAVMILMLTYVIPQFKDMFDSIGSELPIYTRVVIWLGDKLKEDYLMIIAIVVVAVVAFKKYAATSAGRHQLDKLKMKAPIIGELTVKTNSANFARTMSTLVDAGMSMMEAMEISADTMPNIWFKEAVEKAKNGVALGMELSTQLDASGLFPTMLINMIAIGEETGNMSEMLTKVAGYYEEEVENTTQAMTSMMEPIIIVAMAGVVGVLVMCIYGPMAQLYQDLG